MSRNGTADPGALEDNLAAILASEPGAMADPFPVWKELRQDEPVFRHGPRVLISRYADVKGLVKDKNGLSSRAFIEGSQAEAILSGLTPEQRKAHIEISDFEANYVSRSDGDSHSRLRRIAHAAFTPRRVVEMESTIQRYADELIDQLAESGEADFVSGLAYLLPLVVITDMLGVPEADRQNIHEWSSKLGRNRGGDDPVALMEAHAAIGEFKGYVEGLIAEKRNSPAETDLLTALMQAEEGETLSTEELTAMFVVLLFAGHETTTNLLGNGLLEMHRQPGQWSYLCQNPDGTAGAVEELLRFVSPVQWLVRVAQDPILIHGQEIEANETVFLLLAAANRDPEVFSDPDRLDLSRPESRDHIALGFGPHYCLGNALARLEGAVTFRTLADRFPGMKVETEDVKWRGNAKLRGIEELRVTLSG